MLNGLNSPSARTQPHVGREQGSPQGGYDGRSQYDVPEIMVLRAEVRAPDIGPGFVIPNRAIEEVQPDAVRQWMIWLMLSPSSVRRCIPWCGEHN